MLTKIEEFIFGGNVAHDLIEVFKDSNQWLITVSPVSDHSIKKKFCFLGVQENYEQHLTDDGGEIEYPLPIIGFDSKLLPNGLWEFCLNVSDVEWGFISEWPKMHNSYKASGYQ